MLERPDSLVDFCSRAELRCAGHWRGSGIRLMMARLPVSEKAPVATIDSQLPACPLLILGIMLPLRLSKLKL
jgi:hypothetical protein